MKLKGIVLSIIALFIIAVPMTGSAYDLPSLNLGFTSFMDGAPPSGPGLYFTEYVQYWTADEFEDGASEPLFPSQIGEDLTAWISLSQITYQSDTEVMLGGKFGIDVLLPYVSLDLSYKTPGPLADNGTGIGDIWVGPYLQWDPIMGENGPKFMHRFSLGFIIPTGDYEVDKELNQGSNFFSFNPYWAATYFVTPKWTATTRIYYLWNGKNDDPNRYAVANGVTEVQAGQAIHINFASSYEVIQGKLRLGINGYYLRQIKETEYNGVDQAGSKEKIMAIGPGMLFSFNKDAHLFLNTYIERESKSRPEGERVTLRFVYHF